MLPKNPLSALVGIAVEKSGEAVGSGFIFHKAADGMLILTCRHIVDQARDVAAAATGHDAKLWIEGSYEADTVFESPREADTDLAVLRCMAPELLSRDPLPLGQPLKVVKTRVVCDAGDGSQQLRKPHIVWCDFLGGDVKTEFILRNDPEFPIAAAHRGSPVIDDNWAVGIVSGLGASPTDPAQNEADLILATPVEQLATLWRDKPEDLIAGPVPVELKQAISAPAHRAGPLQARFLLAVSTPEREANLQDEVAVVQETIARRLRPGSAVEIWQWDSAESMHRLFPSATGNDGDAVPSFAEFDSVILIAGRNLGPRRYGLAELERDTRDRPRLIYLCSDAATESARAFVDGLRRDGVDCEPYQGLEFADRFARDFHRLVGELSAIPPRQHISSLTRLLPANNEGPYRGLSSYSLKHSALFNGRARETTELRNILAARSNSFLIVLGASGSGKSSLVRAGLLHRLELNAIPGSSDWIVLDFRLSKAQAPLDTAARELYANTPLQSSYPNEADLKRDLEHLAGVEHAIALALSASPKTARLVLLIDQFEELFTLIKESGQRFPFLQFLHDAASQPRVHVVVTLRSDFYAKLLEPDFAKLMDGHQLYTVKPPEEQALVAAMYWPAEVSGYRFEDSDLFVQILREAGGSAGALPLLSYALEQLAKRAQRLGKDRVMTWSTYKQIGRVQGVIEAQIDDAIADLGAPPADETLNNLFRRLVTVDDSGAPTKKPAVFTKDDQSWTGEAIRLKEALVERRLLLTDSPDQRTSTIEIAHEALLSSWGALKDWIGRSRSALLLLQSVDRAAREWQAARRATRDPEGELAADHGRLWRQDRIDEVSKALALLDQSTKELSADAQAFLRPEFERLVEELEIGIVDHRRRSEIGERLAQLGDRRPGVGLRKDGVPDIVWCAVPAGKVSIFDAAGTSLGVFEVPKLFVARYPVTLAQFEAFTKVYFDEAWWAGLPVGPRNHAVYPQTPPTGNQPAQFVSWYQAVAFCNWLSQSLGYSVRLPTEWEWVQAATSGHADYLYPWGTDWDVARANHKEGSSHLVSVGLYPQGRSPAGVDDLSGNMYEWCLNEYGQLANLAPSKEPRTTRGGAFFLPPPGRGPLLTVADQLNIRHRLRDNADGIRDDGRRVAVCIRLASDAVPPAAVLAPR